MITHPEKVLFPDDGITKGEVAAYYEAMAPVILTHLRGRPITMERYPGGIGTKGFWQKDGVVHHPVVTGTAALQWITNQNTITQHVWASRPPDLNRPDLCVFDRDPSGDDVADVRAAALGLRDLLATLDLQSWVKAARPSRFLHSPAIPGPTPQESGLAR